MSEPDAATTDWIIAKVTPARYDRAFVLLQHPAWRSRSGNRVRGSKMLEAAVVRAIVTELGLGTITDAVHKKIRVEDPDATVSDVFDLIEARFSDGMSITGM